MKKLFTILAIISAVPVSAQLRVGVRGGVNLIDNDITAISTETIQNQDSYTGYYLGPMAELQFPNSCFALDLAALYSKNGLEITKEHSVENTSVAFPVSLKLTLDLGNLFDIFVQGGGQFSYKTGELQKQIATVKEGNSNQAEVKEFIMDKSTWSVNVGAGIKLQEHIQAGVNYNIPVTREGIYSFYDNVSRAADGSFDDLQEIDRKGQEAFQTSTLQFVLTYVF